jgi:YggT family protein
VIVVIQIAQLFLQVLIFSIFARSLLSWFPIERNGVVFQALDAIVEPILMPLRKVIPTMGMIDLTPMVAIVVLYVISSALASAA